MRNWYRKGAEVPEQLSRFLFLEEALPGRRVLYVGAGGSELEEALVELGARSVVCLPEPTETQSPQDADEPGQTMWPGTAGAFDLIVDFGLAAAVERGDDWRLTEIKRLLSEDGFALATWDTGESPGLARFFGGPSASDVDAAEPGTMAYGDWVRLLLDRFELVEVYFQTLLLGYFFGSFELDTSDDGIAPHTGLMGTEPEPAAHYIFAFGNAVPFLQDASLVQLPLTDVFQNWEHEHAARLSSNTESVPESRSEPGGDVSSGSPLPTLQRDDLVGMCAELEEEGRAKNHEIRRLGSEKDAAIATLHELEKELRRSLELNAAAEERNFRHEQEIESLRSKLATAEAKVTDWRLAEERDLSAHQRWQDERERLRHRARSLEERMQALQTKLANVSEERDQAREEAELLGEELDAHDQRPAAALQSSGADGATDQKTAPARVEPESFEASLQEAEADFEAGQRDENFESQAILREKEEALARLAKGVNTLVQEREMQQHAWEAERAEHERILSTERQETASLRNENAALRSQLEQMQARFAEVSQGSLAHQSQSSELQTRTEKAEAKSVDLESRLRTAQAAMESRSRQAGVAQQAFHEAAAQRDTLQRVLETRDQEAASLREELSGVLAELERYRQAEKAASLWRNDEEGQDAHDAVSGPESVVSELDVLRTKVDMQEELLLEARREHNEIRDAYNLTLALLDEARDEFTRVNGNNELTKALLDEARQDHSRVSTESELMRTLLEEARASHERVQAEADLASALLEDARAAHRYSAEPTAPQDQVVGSVPRESRAELPVSDVASADTSTASIESTVEAKTEAATVAEPPTPS